MRGPCWTSCSLLLSQQLHLLPVETPNLTEDHYREKQRNNWLDEDSRRMHGRMFGRMNNRVLVVNELSAAGNQVASFMKSQRAFSASFPNFLFFTLTSLCALFPENPLTVLILDSIPIYLNTFLLCELVSHVYGHHCIPQVLPVLNLNQTQTHTHSDISKHHFKTPRPYLFPSVPPYI